MPKNYEDQSIYVIPSEIFIRRDYKIIDLNSDIEENEKKLAYAKGLFENIILFKDTLNGIRFSFLDDCKYKTFIDVYTMMLTKINKKDSSYKTEEGFNFIMHNGNIWVFNYYHKPLPSDSNTIDSFPIYSCGGVLSNREENNSIKNISILFSYNYFEAIKEFFFHFWQSSLIFVALIILSTIKFNAYTKGLNKF